MARPVVLVCRERRCSEHGDSRAKLIKALGRAAQVQEVPCQNFCKGPTAAVRVGGRWQWFWRLRGGEARQALLDCVETGEIGGLEAYRAGLRE
jgi:hypothetical protein